ncbi:MAG: TonB-dependent receptor [Bacteroidota bacterium]
MIKKIAIVLILLGNGILFGQQTQGKGGQQGGVPKGVVFGTVTDKQSGKPIEYANIVLYRTKDSAMITGAVSDNKGKFRIEKVPFGNIFAKVNFIGFKIQTIRGIRIKPDTLERDLGVIHLEPTVANLSEVAINGEKQQMEYNLDKKVINVDKDMVSAGGTAIDIMQKIPSVSVDVEGTVSLRGSSNVTILVDGRPSTFTDLDQIPAGMIDKVEIVTNPSARYDPDGMSGIINIVMKKPKEAGYNGMVSLNAGTGDKYTGSVNLNFRQKKVNIFANYDFRYFSMKGYTDQNRESTYNDTSSFLDQHQNSGRLGQFNNFKAGADFFINDKNTLTITGEYGIRKFTTNETTHYAALNYLDFPTSYYVRQTHGTNSGGGPEGEINYKKTFKKKNQEFTSNISFEQNPGDNTSLMAYEPYHLDYTPISVEPDLQNSITKSLNTSIIGQADYFMPLWAGGRMETGYKYSYKNSDLDYLQENKAGGAPDWIKDTNTSNNFVYNEQIHAAYLIYSNSIANFKYQAGVRAEYATTISNQKTSGQKFTNSYFNFFPTIHLKYEFTEENALQLSYSRRVNRPSWRSLNPFINNSDPLNISAGNPYLKPEYINSFELAHLISIKKTSLSTTVFYRQIDHIISRIMTLEPGGVTYSTYQNLNKGQSYGLELIVSQQVGKWWKINANASVFGQKFSGTQLTNAFKDATYSWTAKINSSMALKVFDLQVSFNYNSAVTTVTGQGGRFMPAGTQGKQAELYFMDIGVKKDLWKNRITVSARVSDVLKSQKYSVVTTGDNFNQSMVSGRDSRVLFLGVTYKINGGIKQKRQPDDNGDNSDY